MGLFRRHLFQLPFPRDLGWSESNALGLRKITPYQEGKSWEDWHEYCRLNFPVRYFLSETLLLWFKRWVLWPLQRVWDFALDYCVPRRRRHILDLRGIDPLSGYRHGYMDPCEVFWLAGWGSLMRWYRESGGKDPRSWMTLDEQAECSSQLASHGELMALVHYWSVTRIERDRCNQELYAALHAITPTAENRSSYQAAQKTWLDHCWETERLEEDMWLRLAKMRSYLWD